MNFDVLNALDPERDAPGVLTADDEILLQRILAQPRLTSARRTRTYARRSLVVTAAVAVVVGLGLTRIDLGGTSVGATPAAAAVLQKAAGMASAEPDLVVGPGQYLRITLVQQSWNVLTDPDHSPTVGSDGRIDAWQERWTRQIWIPYNTDADWTFREHTKVLRSNSTDGIDRARSEADLTGVTTYKRASWSKRGTTGYIPTYDPQWFANLPRDPAEMLPTIRRAISPGDGSSSAHLFDEVYSEVLRSGLAPANIRAALFDHLASSPGTKVVDAVTNLEGSPGVAIAYGDAGKQLLFDPANGRYIGERASDPTFPDVPGLDQAKTTFLSSTTTAVVDSAPATR